MTTVINGKDFFHKEMRCSIKGCYIEPLRDPKTNEIVWAGGNNAEPINDGRCCNDCNAKYVIPARLRAIEEQDRRDRRLQTLNDTKKYLDDISKEED